MDPGQDVRLQIQTDLLTCPLCRRPYVKPRTLPCHHTFCETCVARCAGSYLTFPCPSCRQDAAVPVSGVSGFPEDVFLSRLSFKIRTIEEPYVTPYVINECLTHQREPIRFYCQTCEKPLCRVCPRGNHNSHKVSHIEEQIERMKERVGTALSDQRQRSATAVTSLQEIRRLITEHQQQKNAMECHVEARVHERIKAIKLEGEALQKELDSMYDKHLSRVTGMKKDLESMVETLLTFDVEAERELARGGLVDVNRHGEISEKLKIMYETMNRPVKHSSGFQATFVPIDIGSDPLVGYLYFDETSERPLDEIDGIAIKSQSSEHASHVEEQTFNFDSISPNGKYVQNGHERGSTMTNDWERVELRNGSKLTSQNTSRRSSATSEATPRTVDEGSKFGSLARWMQRKGSERSNNSRRSSTSSADSPVRRVESDRARSVSVDHSGDKREKGFGVPDHRIGGFADELQGEEVKSERSMRRQMSEPARPIQRQDTATSSTQSAATSSGDKREKGFWVPGHRIGGFPFDEPRGEQVKSERSMRRQMSEPARPTQRQDTATRPTQSAATSSGPPTPLSLPNTMTKISDNRVNFSQPYGVTVSRDGLIAVVDQKGDQSNFESTVVHMFDQSGAFIRSFDAPGCHQVAEDAEGRLLLTNSARRQVDVFDTSGTLLQSFGTFSFPMGIAVSPKDGTIYVTEPPGDRVCVYAADFALVRRVGSPHSRLDERFRSPYFVSSDASGRILVSDLSNHCVKVMDSDYNLQLKIGSQGSRAGQLQYPCGVAVDHQDNFIVVDHGNSRVLMFDSSGNFVKTIVTRDQGLVKPADVAVLPNGKIVLTDMKGGAVYILHS
ncbi:tripartite motif-containing protein 2-like [Branchiostoma floridae]|uniref:RING-type E3 ubiquitin transferase n=1 Tax=Branchiostoma floridae TaxID=7739 RepID=A0A9J7K6F7_BRAFL|nr:tripartite motif-containing protein 2-like [Branchiostoma floridae]